MRASAHTEASLLNTGSGGIPGPRRWLLQAALKEFGNYPRGHFVSSEHMMKER